MTFFLLFASDWKLLGDGTCGNGRKDGRTDGWNFRVEIQLRRESFNLAFNFKNRATTPQRE